MEYACTNNDDNNNNSIIVIMVISRENYPRLYILSLMYAVRASFSLRKAFRRLLKPDSVSESVMWGGRAFHTLGPKPVRECPPVSVRVRGTCSLCWCRVVWLCCVTSFRDGKCIYQSGNIFCLTL